VRVEVDLRFLRLDELRQDLSGVADRRRRRPDKLAGLWVRCSYTSDLDHDDVGIQPERRARCPELARLELANQILVGPLQAEILSAAVDVDIERLAPYQLGDTRGPGGGR
jgi:hypothetical protein